MARIDKYFNVCGEYTNFQYDLKNKDRIIKDNIVYMMSKISQMFVYENLPESIDVRELEIALQTKGYLVAIKNKDNLYCLIGSLGGIPNEMYQPTLAIVTNPFLKLTTKNETEYEINKDCIILNNDSMRIGVLPLLSKYSTFLAENDITLNRCLITARAQALTKCTKPQAKKNVDEFFKNLEKGEVSAVIDKTFDEIGGIENQPLFNATSNLFTQLTETEQYLKANLYNELGIQSNFNMKREVLSENECSLNSQAVVPFILDMFTQRVRCWNKINEMFGTNVIVKLNNLWADNIQSNDIDEVNKDIEDNTDNTTNTETNKNTENERMIENENT